MANPKSRTFGVISRGDEDVRRFYVAVNDSLCVRGIERIRNFNGQREQEPNLEWTVSDPVLERVPVQELHGDEGLGVMGSDFVDGADVRVIQGRRCLSLPLETAQSLGIPGNLVRQKLQRHKAVQTEIFGFVHHSTAPAAQLLNYAVMGDGFAESW